MNLYIDHQNEAILYWADKEVLTGDEGHEFDIQIYDIMEYKHEPDEEVHTFLTKLLVEIF